MQPTLLILAAGMASRYGSMKQIQSFGPGGETIMDYSIYDAIRAGYKKVVFIIRKEFHQDFADIFEPRLKGKIEIDYVYQEVTDGRTKPWGTAQAVLCAKDAIKEPFAVINADDFYGRDAFEKSYKFLTSDVKPDVYSIIGYELLKTLSDNGTVNRGVCQVNAEGNLSSIAERLNIAMKDGKILCDDDQQPKELDTNSKVSMNFWCFDASVFSYTENLFNEFRAANAGNPKAEFFIPLMADQYIQEKAGVIKVIPTSSKWFGVTYKEDAPEVKAALEALVNAGEYPPALWK
ncbi:nucleotidyltransferase [Pseudoflavitalea sp. G-6-1-2]|uniref:sugar phosphate nucleotidyltransferase n=1 Tax=Pseudoflavitalea sp. G-6-1-2 TaxID=2728841 RepID=UPI00146ADBD6|nr:sugar phosphate nucleotidyltransferase [Pseudoflavitalea sp. G-6-1-2]NML23320.1 nucleotidyltransferase [Pseudoflavitalea sp. G-6-1-2]